MVLVELILPSRMLEIMKKREEDEKIGIKICNQQLFGVEKKEFFFYFAI